jgi:gliding motility-associated-like protein
MIDQSTGQIDTWSWTISSENGSIQSSNLQNPLFSLPNNLSGNITFQLTVSNNQGCTDNATSVLTILEDAAIYIPNSFSPDGDNFNNIFQVVGRNIDPEFFELTIFNRWGELIFLSKDLNVGWDGSVNTYGPAPIGVYTYKVSFRFANQDDNQTITGHLNLLR